ncbi:carboxylic ester hydrolase [Actinorhabdospora filicis]|uniref:Carboxylic ester hydrolase n=1 Tax=Actinorhabdospora filicis TaxID=1785913 RepID=A0A9W6W3V4_9ACTN|nr:carboxylesterase family protein [Actinorhabdospora filicis]GLZ78577.1 carboxylic ester hydrolase [Actinorhabdospora filicis]
MAAALAALLLLLGCTKKGDDMTIVTTTTGDLRGVADGGTVRWQGIPYAAPPVGELRWAPPAPAAKWEGVRDASEPGSPCPQLPAAYGGAGSTNEDCLFLNVTAPKDAEGLPVVVWIHGDGAIGSGDVFDGRALAAKGVVVVTINYRLGVFGAFAHPELPDSGTVGFQDQRAALRWVGAEIAGFGGDPQNVTLMGVSFGATAIAGHLMSPGSRGLFQKAIMHSGFSTMDAPAGALFPQLPALPRFGWKEDAEMRAIGASVAAELGCGDLACLRRKSVQDLLAYPQVMNIFQGYILGNEQLPGDPIAGLGEVAGIPVLAGSTKDEHRAFTAIRAMSGAPITAADYEPALKNAFPDHWREVAGEYPLSDYANAALAFSAVMTDRMWARQTATQNDLLAERNPLWFFEFADENPPATFPFPEDLPGGAHHNADIGYLFPTPEFAASMSDGQRALSDTMLTLWARFARDGDPGDGWANHSPGAPVRSFAPGAIGPVDFAGEHRLAFWAGITA